MKFTARLFLFLAAFDVGAAILYAVVGGEPAGLTMLYLAGGLHAIIGGYVWRLTRRHAVGPEDREDAEVSDGAGTVGFFSAGSVWPFAVGLTAALAATAWLFAPLSAVAGGVLLVGAVLGLATEYWRVPR
jgi:hypothetical protein